jgi:hypothetical protein
MDYSERDNNVAKVLYILIQRKDNVGKSMFRTYWRKIHGSASARLPGQYQYKQFHLDYYPGCIWRVNDNTEYKIIEEERLDGIAELTFLSEEDCETFINSLVVLNHDERNFVNKADIYFTTNANSKTYVDKIENGAYNGKPNLVKLHVMVSKSNLISVDEFRKYMKDILTSNIIKNDLVLKYRLHLLDHDKLFNNPYHAAFEIAFKSRLDMENFFTTEQYAAAVKYETKYIKQIAAYPEGYSYTFVYDGKLISE